jgi:hypothetical protein
MTIRFEQGNRFTLLLDDLLYRHNLLPHFAELLPREAKLVLFLDQQPEQQGSLCIVRTAFQQHASVPGEG